jgi:hypothetical protein
MTITNDVNLNGMEHRALPARSGRGADLLPHAADHTSTMATPEGLRAGNTPSSIATDSSDGEPPDDHGFVVDRPGLLRPRGPPSASPERAGLASFATGCPGPAFAGSPLLRPIVPTVGSMVDVLGSPDINRLGQRPLIVRRLLVLGNPVVTVNREPGLVPDETSRPSLSTVTAQLSCRK